MQRFAFLALAALWLPLGLTAPALAQVAPPTQMLSLQQIEDLVAGLRFLDGGSVDQCPKVEPPKDAKDAKPAAPAAACPFDRSPALVIAIARNIVGLQPADSEFQIARNSMRVSVLADKTLVVAPSCPDERCVTVAAAATTERQGAKFVVDLTPLAKEQRAVALAKIKLADLKLDVNHIPSSVVAELAPIIDDFNASAPK